VQRDVRSQNATNSPTAPPGRGPAPGKRTLTEELPVQRREAAGAAGPSERAPGGPRAVSQVPLQQLFGGKRELAEDPAAMHGGPDHERAPDDVEAPRRAPGGAAARGGGGGCEGGCTCSTCGGGGGVADGTASSTGTGGGANQGPQAVAPTVSYPNTVQSSYDVPSSTLKGALQDMKTNGHNNWPGYTQFSMSYSGTRWDASNTVTEVDGTTVSTTQYLPNWTGRASATDGAKTEWDRFNTALVSHENQHLDIDKNGYGKYRGFDAIAAAAIGMAADTVQGFLDGSSSEVGNANSAFDTDTRHGATTGASLDITKDPASAQNQTGTGNATGNGTGQSQGPITIGAAVTAPVGPAAGGPKGGGGAGGSVNVSVAPATLITQQSGYQFHGTLAQAAQSQPHGRFEWDAPTDRRTQSGCTVTLDAQGNADTVTIHIVTRKYLPSWLDESNASRGAQAEWDRFVAAVDAYETSLLPLVQQAYQTAAQGMVGTASGGLRAALQAAETAAQAAVDAQDLATSVGESVGAKLDGSVG
jgi:predicted secreted Zn-dependent protease